MKTLELVVFSIRQGTMTEAEWSLVEQDLHLACTVGILTELPPETRRVYLLGEVLTVPDQVGAQAARVTPAAYRKRLERARRSVAKAVLAHGSADAGSRTLTTARELDNLVRRANFTACTIAAARRKGQRGRSHGSPRRSLH